MKNQRIMNGVSTGFILVCALSLVAVSLMAFVDPQAVMDLVAVSLPNTDAFSSIRGVYGGAGMAMVVLLLYLVRRNREIALLFLTLLWGLYALSRLITIFVEGPLGPFGTQWIIIECTFFIIALVLFSFTKRINHARN
jgi:hypothetical protein